MDDTLDIEDFKPCVPMYGPINIKDLKNGDVKYWCRCGLSKTQPWCDNSHIGTGFKPLKWVVGGTVIDGKQQAMYQICNCKYTKSPPFCDATHCSLPLKYGNQQRQCKRDHNDVEKLCVWCGYRPKDES